MAKSPLDLRMLVELYYGEFPVRSNDKRIKSKIEAEDGDTFCAVIFKNDLPDNVHNTRLFYLIRKLSESQRRKDISPGRYWPFFVSKRDNYLILPPIEGVTPERLESSIMVAGGLFFGPGIGNVVVNELIKCGYEIEKKYRI